MISIVIPFFNERGNIVPLFREVSEVMRRDFTDQDYEIIMVDDGSRDGTWDEIRECKEHDDRVVGMRLNTNYGQSIALDVGFSHARWDIVFSLDGDGQNDPNEFIRLYRTLEEGEYDIVAWWRQNRKNDPVWMRVVTRIARFLRRNILDDGVHDSGCTLRVYRQWFIEDLYLWGEMHRYIMAIAKIRGFRTTEIPVSHRARTSGRTKYNWSKSVKGFIDLLYIWFIYNYQGRPLHLFGALGLLNLGIGASMLFVALLQNLIYDISFFRNGFLVLGVFFFQIGLIFFMFGIVLDVVIRDYYHGSKEKRYIIREIM